MNIENLKTARRRSGMTQPEVASFLKIGDSTYKNYEQGNREPKGEMLVKLANLFGVTTDYLLGRETGEAEPIDKFANDFALSALEKKILDNYLSLPKSMRGDLMDFLEKSVSEILPKND